MLTPMSPHHLTQWMAVSADTHVPTSSHAVEVSQCRHPCPYAISRSGGQSVQTPMSPRHLTQWRSVSADTHVPTSSHTVEVSQCRHPCPHVISCSRGQSMQTPMSPLHLTQWRSVTMSSCYLAISCSGGQSVHAQTQRHLTQWTYVCQCRHYRYVPIPSTLSCQTLQRTSKNPYRIQPNIVTSYT